MFLEPLDQYKNHLLNEVNNADILVENKMLLLDAIDNMILNENASDDIFLTFRKYGIEVCTYTTFYKGYLLDIFLEDNI